MPAALNAHFFNTFCSFAQAGSICQPHGQAAKIAGFFKKVPRCTGNIGNQGAVAPKQRVHETGLARIDRPGQHNHSTLLHDPRPAAALKQMTQGPSHFFHSRAERGRIHAFHFVLGKIHGHADLHAQVFKLAAQSLRPAGQQPVQPVQAVTQGFARRRGNQLGHSFSLAQVHTPVDKGTTRKFALLRLTRPETQGSLKH